MEITISELLKGRATRIKKNEYLKTEAYVTPFLNKMSKFTNDFRVQVKLPDQITKTTDGEIDMDDITYNRVWIQAVMPEEYAFDNHQEVVGMVYGLDTRKPVVKIYRGGLNMACTNLCVFNPSFLNVQELEPEKTINFSSVDTLMNQTNDLKVWLEKLHKEEFKITPDNVNESMGRWINNCWDTAWNKGYGTVKVSDSLVLGASKLLFRDEESPYYVGKDTATDMFNVYNAFTQMITDDSRDIMNKFEKTYLIKDILSL